MAAAPLGVTIRVDLSLSIPSGAWCRSAKIRRAPCGSRPGSIMPHPPKTTRSTPARDTKSGATSTRRTRARRRASAMRKRAATPGSTIRTRRRYRMRLAKWISFFQLIMSFIELFQEKKKMLLKKLLFTVGHNVR